jgi:hypothetical protein
LALAYLVLVGLVVAMLSTWASNNLNNSANFTAANSMTVAASGMTDLAIQYVRYNPLISDSTTVELPTPFVPCWGGTSVTAIQAIDGDQVAVWCSTVWNPLVAQTRTVTFDACPITVAKNICTASTPASWLLTATVVYDDYPPAPAKSAPIQTLCTVYCGEGMTIVNWQWGSSATGSVTTGVAASMSFTNEPSDTNADTSTQAAVTVLDASSNPVAGDTVTLVQQSGPSCGSPSAPGVSSPTSGMTAITDSDGIAEFTNIIPQCPGAYTLTAVDGSVSATSSSFQVAEPRSVITTSTAPTNATQGPVTYQVSATASSGDTLAAGTIVIADTTTSVCTLNKTTFVVTFVGPGTCTITFNDPATGNPNYAPALQVTQSFQVGGTAATQVGIALATTTPNASATTNDSVTVTLENAVGAPVKSTGTTTVILSDTGSGFFAVGNGTTGATSYNLGITNGNTSGTVYFGGQNTGPDSISVVNGTNVWGTAPLTIVSGTPTQVAITPSTNTPGVSSTTNTTLSLQLEDAYGNLATTAAPLTLTLSAGSGYFANATGTAGTATLSVTFASNAGSTTAYFGDQTSGTDTITAKNGTTTWGTSALTLAPGPPTQVLITLSPTNPVLHTTTNVTVALQLEDQFGNAVPLAGVVLTLSNSGAGFFSKTTNNTGTPTLTLTAGTNASGAATAFFGDNTTQSVTITATGTGTYSGISSTSSPLND